MLNISQINDARQGAPVETSSGPTIVPAGASTNGTFGTYQKSFTVDFPEQDNFVATAPIRQSHHTSSVPNLL